MTGIWCVPKKKKPYRGTGDIEARDIEAFDIEARDIPLDAMDALSKRDPEPDMIDIPQVDLVRRGKKQGKKGGHKKGGHKKGGHKKGGHKKGGHKGGHKKGGHKGGHKKGGHKKGHKGGKRDNEGELSSRLSECSDLRYLLYGYLAPLPNTYHMHHPRGEYLLEDLGTSPIKLTRWILTHVPFSW
jgi:hypothetical protein